VIIYAVFYALLSQNGGFVSTIITSLTGARVEIISSPALFRWILFASDMWQSAGWGAIIFLAAITTIDPALYEAARIDGAGRLQMIRLITLPCIAPVIIFVLITRVGRVLDAGFEQVFIFYNPLVYSTGDIFDTWVFRVGLEQRAFSLAAAVGLFKSIIGFALIVGTNKVARRFGRGLW
jgi:putative aldouronate transport system permease protein